jgi:putative flippase GtrA
MSPAWANLPALTFGLVIQFVGNKRYAFRDRSPQVLRQGSLFLAVETGAFLLNAGAFHLLSPILGLPWLLARALATSGVYFGFSYPLWGRIFRPG